MKSEGEVVAVWNGKGGTFWCLMRYWIGTGYQYVEREITETAYNLYRDQK